MAMPNKCCICKTDAAFEWIGIHLGESNCANKKLEIKKLVWNDVKQNTLLCKGCAIGLFRRLPVLIGRPYR